MLDLKLRKILKRNKSSYWICRIHFCTLCPLYSNNITVLVWVRYAKGPQDCLRIWSLLILASLRMDSSILLWARKIQYPTNPIFLFAIILSTNHNHDCYVSYISTKTQFFLPWIDLKVPKYSNILQGHGQEYNIEIPSRELI